MLHEYKRIIVARTDRIGDVVLSLPVFASLRKCFPNCRLTALVSGYTSQVATSCRSVDDVILYDREESIHDTQKKLRDADPDAVLMLYPRFRLAAAAFLAEIPIRVGTAFRWYSFLFNMKVYEHRKDSTRSEADYNLDLAEAIGCKERVLDIGLEIDPQADKVAKSYLWGKEITRFVIVHPGSGGSAAEWSVRKVRELVEMLSLRRGIQVVVTGTATESAICTEVSEGIPNVFNTAGKFSLSEFVALIAQSELFVANSTGPLHLAAAVHVPVIGLYPNNKPMTPVRWAPITDKKKILTPADGSDDLSLVSVNDVLDSAVSLLSVGSAGF